MCQQLPAPTEEKMSFSHCLRGRSNSLALLAVVVWRVCPSAFVLRPLKPESGWWSQHRRPLLPSTRWFHSSSSWKWKATNYKYHQRSSLTVAARMDDLCPWIVCLNTSICAEINHLKLGKKIGHSLTALEEDSLKCRWIVSHTGFVTSAGEEKNLTYRPKWKHLNSAGWLHWSASQEMVCVVI